MQKNCQILRETDKRALDLFPTHPNREKKSIGALPTVHNFLDSTYFSTLLAYIVLGRNFGTLGPLKTQNIA